MCTKKYANFYRTKCLDKHVNHDKKKDETRSDRFHHIPFQKMIKKLFQLFPLGSIATLSHSNENTSNQLSIPVHALRVKIDRGPTELVQHSAYRRNSHRRKGAAIHIIDMVWLYRLSTPVGRRGGILLVQMKTTCLRGA